MNPVTIIACLIFGSPVIYLIYLVVRLIIDPIADKVNAINRSKYFGENEIIHVTTYQNENIFEEDIMNLFFDQWLLYKQRYFLCKYKVYHNKDEQSYAWSLRTTKQSFGWGTIYNIRFHFSNGWVYLSTSNNNFYSGGISSEERYILDYDYASYEIENILNTCQNEAKIIWRMNNREPSNNFPFNFYSLYNNTKSSPRQTNKK